jgi:hypothetical protein
MRSSLFAKAWRVSVIATQQPLKRVEVSDVLLFKIIGAAVSCMAVYLLVWALVDGPSPVRSGCTTAWSATETSVTTCTFSCNFGSTYAWEISLIVVELCVLLYGTSIAFQLWHVHDVFSESRWLVLAIYNMLFQLVYIVLTRALVPVDSSSYTLTRMITTFVAYMVLMNAILLPKFVELMLGTSITLHDFSRKTESLRAPPAAGVLLTGHWFREP